MSNKSLTDFAVKHWKPDPSRRVEVPDDGCAGLYLVVQPSGAKSWAFRYRFDGKPMKYTIGSYPAVSGQAHSDAGKALESVRLGIDPAANKRRGPPPEGAVKALIAIYREQVLGEGVVTNNTRKKAERELKRIEAAIGNRQFKSVTKHDLQKIIDARIADGVHAQKATHVRVVAFCTWASKRLDIDSPADNLAKPIEDTERDRFLGDVEIRLLWKAATDAGGAPGALVKLLLLTGCRRDEICYLERSEVNGEAITIKGERTKNKLPHRIPITPMICKVLDDLPTTGRFVVTGRDVGLGGHSKAKLAVAPAIEPWAFHDLRRTFASGLARLGVPIQVTELCLNHKSGVRGNPLVRIYQKHDFAVEVVAAFEKWSRHVASVVKREKAAA